MANVIIIRLHPDQPVSPTDFTNYLTGLTITAYDLSYASAKADPATATMIGQATYLPSADPNFSNIALNQIQQHAVTFFPISGILIDVTGGTPESAATAMIVVNEPAGYTEYVAPDLLLQVSRAGVTVAETTLYYDVVTTNAAVPAVSEQILVAFGDPAFTSLYLPLPPPANILFSLPPDGTPPNFTALENAVNTVLAADPGGALPSLASLSVDQCANIAREIVWGPQPPLPKLPDRTLTGPFGFVFSGALEEIYSNPQNNGSTSNPLEQSRAQFEGSLNSYYATNDAKAQKLTKFVVALAAAHACSDRTAAATSALISFPPNPGAITLLATVHEDQIDVTGLPAGTLSVSPDYFYILGANLPIQTTANRRFATACGDKASRLVAELQAGLDSGTIAIQPINPAQVARRLAALVSPPASASSCPVTPSIQGIVNDWLNYAGSDDAIVAAFWTPEATAPATAGGFLDLVISALTQGFAPLAAAIKATLQVGNPLRNIASVADLSAATPADWQRLFGSPVNVALLPPFTAPGTPAVQVNAFIRHVQKFFDLGLSAQPVLAPVGNAPPGLPLPTNDPIENFVVEYQLLVGGVFVFGAGALNPAQVQAAAAVVFPGDSEAQNWLIQRVNVLNDLCLISAVQSGVAPPVPSITFSIAEALYARGFTSIADVQAVSASDFQDSLRGTIAYDYAAAIYATAGAVGPPPPPVPGPFQPVNPGTLTDCIPPCHLSPLGPVEYLHELLQLSGASTCADPFAAPGPGQLTLEQAVSSRRGPLGDLLATSANLDTQLPLIDIVNESLENLVVSVPGSTSGVIYDTAGDELAGHKLCKPCCTDPSKKPDHDCHEPEMLFAALPQYSAPATPVAQPGAYDDLKSDFSAPDLPYSEPLDICRSYLEHMGTCRFEALRTLRKEITEFVLDPTLTAPTFETHLWRYPLRIDIAIEYLGLTPEEYDLLFVKDLVETATAGQLLLQELYGFDVAALAGQDWTLIVVHLSEFLKRTGLTYCEFLELQNSGFVSFVSVFDRRTEEHFPACEPCCLSHYSIHFINPADPHLALKQLAIFIRLWRKLQTVCGARYSFSQLADICSVLNLFVGTSVNPDFIRQLVAFQILRDHFRLALSSKSVAPGATGADRTQLLALWVGPAAAKWKWAIAELLDRIQHYSKSRHRAKERPPEFIKLLAANLDPLSRLAGFDPNAASDTWHALPTHTLRFAEVLAKVYASHFSVGEILYLFTADEHLDGDDPFPLQAGNEALDMPLDLPDDDHKHSLWSLRRKLLAAEISEEEAREWTWPRIETVLREEFGYSTPAGGSDPLLSLGRHFFPEKLRVHGIPVSTVDRQYRIALSGTVPAMWNAPPDGPFRYDLGSSDLWTQVPLEDHRVIEKLVHLRQLNAKEMQAVQDLYHAPRIDLAVFSFMFTNFVAAERFLIQEPEEEERWKYFQRHFALAYKRCRIIASHLSAHVAAITHKDWEGSSHDAWLVLQSLFADGNLATTPWEDDSGDVPDVTWAPPPSGSAFAAILGLNGPGLLGEFSVPPNKIVWREVRGTMSAFGHENNENDCPLPTLLPAMDLTLTPEQLQVVGIRNGLLISDARGTFLGGGQGFSVRWSGVLLVEEEGKYEFRAGAPTRDGEEPDLEHAEGRRWRVTIGRGQRSWVVLSHHWSGQRGEPSSSLPLRRGAYEIVIDFTQPSPTFSRSEEVYHQQTGFQVKYRGPDTHDRLVAIPVERLFRDAQDETLSAGIDFPGDSNALKLLQLEYSSSLRDIRRTYQRAFKALLFCHHFGLSAKRVAPYDQSELGYMLANPDLFAGVSYYRAAGVFTRHDADFDFNFLPVDDNYKSPPFAEDDRVQPSPKRTQAMFDWWERMFDYTRMREESRASREHPVWLLFDEASERQPDNPAQLLRHMGVDFRHAGLVLNYFEDQTSPVYVVTSDDLEDDRWAVRVWHSELWVRRLTRCFAAADITAARPDLWASDNPAALVAGEAQTGNENLSAFADNGYFENGEPRRYKDLKILNDGLRERARRALIAYLCTMNRVPLPWPGGGTAQSSKDLSALLLLDAEAGLCEKASRIEEGVSAVQTFIRRARLGLEPSWALTPEFLLLWEREFATFKIWESCKRRQLYKENCIEFDDLVRAKKVEAFQFLESELRRCTLTISMPGGLEYWPDQLPPGHPALVFLQKRDPSSLQLLDPAREGLGVLGTPEWNGRPSWLAPLSSESDPSPLPLPTPDLPARDANSHPRPVAFEELRTVAESDTGSATPLPFWIESAIKLGVRFYRIAAAGVPPSTTAFIPTVFHGRTGCCRECGCEHPPLMDEYYFWLVDAATYGGDNSGASFVIEPDSQNPFYDQTADGPTSQTSTKWHDPDQLPTLLAWDPNPAVRLVWCRVHNGQFQQPRHSVDTVILSAGSTADLSYIGRLGDSLTFSVAGGLPPEGYSGTDLPGFRFDLATYDAVALPLIADPPAPNPSPAGLPAYPYFIYAHPGERLFPATLFSPALAISSALRSHCRFEAALKWLELVFNPLQEDCTWIRCGDPSNHEHRPNTVRHDQHGRKRRIHAVRSASAASKGHEQGSTDHGSDDGTTPQPPIDTCCDSTQIDDFTARNRSILLRFLEILIDWADVLKRHDCPESIQQARLLLDTAATILGPRPPLVTNLSQQGVEPKSVANFVPLIPPLNPRLMSLYCRVADQLALVHHCDNARRLPSLTAPYWCEDPCRREWHDGCEECCADESLCCHPCTPYRFLFLIEKAKETVSSVREFGSALLAALEKGDAEFLSSMRAVHEAQLMNLTLRVRKDQWRDSDWQVQALGLSKQSNQTSRRYYAGLIQNQLINGEIQYENNTSSALEARTVSTVTEAISEFMQIIPDLFVGFPCEETWLPLGTKLSGMFQSIARISNDFADIYGTTASLNLTEAGWDRRLQEWVHQVEILDIEIEQMELQILGAERRRHQALQEINNQQLQIEQSREALDFLKEKFTSHELYLFLQKETAALYYRTYEVAFQACMQAERAFNFERGHTRRKFLPCNSWDNLHEGLLAGERLELALRQMEKEYLDLNRREYELTKSISLRLNFPMQYLRLVFTGRCEIEIPEWMFDLDYPGHYMRRIKNVAITLPCVTGPYTGVHCRLTLLSTQTRVDPCLSPASSCCCHDKPDTGSGCEPCEHSSYQAAPQDSRIVRHYGACEAVATSSGQNDSGMFQLNFNDERYLPFEFRGAISRWRIDLPIENNFFDLHTLSDVILQLNYTAREGGNVLGQAAREAARCKLPGDGWIFIDIPHEFPDAWELFRHSSREHKEERDLKVRLSRKLFPFLPHDPEIQITKLVLLFETQEMADPPCPETESCPCPQSRVLASHEVEYSTDGNDEDAGDEHLFTCFASPEWPHLYHGIVKTDLRPFHHKHSFAVTFSMAEKIGEIVRAFVFCHYETLKRCCTEDSAAAHEPPAYIASAANKA